MPKKQLPESNTSTLETRISVLEELFVRLAQAGATNNILGGGFGSVSDQLKTVSKDLKTVLKRLEDISHQMAPLRNLGPESPRRE